MAWHRSVWWWLVVPLGALGVSAAATTMPRGVPITLFAVGFLMGSPFALAESEAERGPWRRLMTFGLAGGVSLVGGAGLMGLLGGVGVLLVGTLAATSPPMVRHWRPRTAASRERERRETIASHEVLPPVSPDWMSLPTSSMDEENLCRAWRLSYPMLLSTGSLMRRLEVVQRRQDLLDELERRNADGFSAWLASGARAAGDPRKYISRRV